MLCPTINSSTDCLAQAYSTIKRVDSFAYAVMNTMIGKLSPDPDWFGPLRKELELLSSAGADWQQKKPGIWGAVLSQFTNYSSLFASIAESSREIGDDQTAWLELLHELSKNLAQGENLTQAAEGQFTLQINNLNNIQQVFNTSLNKAWAQLAEEEQKMLDLAMQVTALQDKINSLGDDLTGTELSSGKSFVQSSVSISYKLLSSSQISIPYLTVASLVFTVGKTFYDTFITDREIGETIDKIVELRGQLTQEAQAAAMSKALIQMIGNFDLALAKVGRQLPAISNIWASEKEKVDQVIQAIQAGSKPTSLFELRTTPAATQTWGTLTNFVVKLQQNVAQGRTVNVTIDKPPAKVYKLGPR